MHSAQPLKAVFTGAQPIPSGVWISGAATLGADRAAVLLRQDDAPDRLVVMDRRSPEVTPLLEGACDGWVCVFDAVNVAEQLCPVLTTGRDWRDWIEQTQVDVLAVYEAGPNISDEHAQAMHGIADVFSEMLSAANCRQMFAAQEAAARKVRGALTANSSTRSVRLVEAWSDR